jgi:hypothetical protein
MIDRLVYTASSRCAHTNELHDRSSDRRHRLSSPHLRVRRSTRCVATGASRPATARREQTRVDRQTKRRNWSNLLRPTSLESTKRRSTKRGGTRKTAHNKLDQDTKCRRNLLSFMHADQTGELRTITREFEPGDRVRTMRKLANVCVYDRRVLNESSACIDREKMSYKYLMCK